MPPLLSLALNPRAVILLLPAATKDDALRAAAEAFAPLGSEGPGPLFERFLKRERQSSTGIGDGVAIPHIVWDGPLTAGIAIAPGGIEFDALDGKPVQVLFMVAGPREAAGEHLKLMARISRMAGNEGLLARLKETHDSGEITGIIKSFEGGY